MEEDYKLVVSTVCFKGDKVLIMKRSSEKKFAPLLWDSAGGRIKRGESFEQAVQREALEETGYNIEIIDVLTTFSIPVDYGFIPGLTFLCRITEDKEPVLTDEHIEYKFISEEEIDNYEFAGNIKEEIKMAYKLELVRS